MQDTQFQSLGCKDPLKKGMATHSSVFGETSPMTSQVKNPPAMQDTQGWEDPLEGEMATHSSILAWRISWKEATVRRVTQSWA